MLDFLGQQRHKILFPALLALIFLALIVSAGGSGTVLASNVGGSVDMLAYTIHDLDGTSSLMLYDPRRGVIAPLLTEAEFQQFFFSVDGRIAFKSAHEGTAEIYVLDTLSPDRQPINISHDPALNDYPLGWSPDGRYLAFESYRDDQNKQIFVWDGETAINITPDNLENTAEYYGVSWSFDGRLAFMVRYARSSPDEGDLGEIYLWDSHTTTNLSQNPTGGDGAPIWNADGRLVFFSHRNDARQVVVWDGVSIQEGSPKLELMNVPPELTAYYSYPTWTDDGQLAFLAQTAQDTHAQIYVWDGQTAINISQNPTLHNGSPRWSADGRWAFVTFFSSQQLLYVRDADNRPLLTVEGQYPPAWSSSGYLAFCQPGWVLSVWDGQQIVEIAHVSSGGVIQAQWQGGNDTVVCSSG